MTTPLVGCEMGKWVMCYFKLLILLDEKYELTKTTSKMGKTKKRPLFQKNASFYKKLRIFM
jgi:hypothetical protein